MFSSVQNMRVCGTGRAGRALARRWPVASWRRTCRRNAHSSGESTTERAGGASNAHGEGHEHTSADEPLGKLIYILAAGLPVSIAIYKYTEPTKPGEKHMVTRFIEQFPDYRKEWETRNTLHTKMVEQAAFDRLLFFNHQPSRHIDLEFPEVFNTGSPYNVPAGHGTGNLDKVIAHYEKKNKEEQDRKMQMLIDGTLPAEQEPKLKSEWTKPKDL